MTPMTAHSNQHEAAQEKDNPLPQPATSAGLDASQGTIGPLGSQGTLVIHVQPVPPYLFPWAVLQPLIAQSAESGIYFC